MGIEIIKNRSLRACLSDALKVYRKNFKTIFKKTWIAAIICTLFLTATLYFRLPNLSLHNWGEANPLTSFLVQTVIYLFTILSAACMGVSVYRLFNNRSFKWNLWRFVKIYFTTIVISQILGGIIGGILFGLVYLSTKASTTASAIVVCLSIVIGMVAALAYIIPLSYAMTKYMINTKTKISQLLTMAKEAYRHFGFILTMFISMMIISFAVAMILFIPLFILIIANNEAQLGALNGDALSLPGYFPYMFCFFAALTIVAAIYLGLCLTIGQVFVYGSIEAQEQDKKLITQYENN